MVRFGARALLGMGHLPGMTEAWEETNLISANLGFTEIFFSSVDVYKDVEEGRDLTLLIAVF